MMNYDIRYSVCIHMVRKFRSIIIKNLEGNRMAKLNLYNSFTDSGNITTASTKC